MLSNRRITVFLNDKSSSTQTVKNGLPQGSILAPLLFNLYTSDLPSTSAQKFIYADDLALAIQSKISSVGESLLDRDLSALFVYYQKWRLMPNPSKSECCSFHLSNQHATHEPTIHFGGSKLRYNAQPSYLGVTLDRSLTYKAHLHRVSQKIKTRNNLIHKLAGSTWGADASTLRTAAIALAYSTAEYCCPVWSSSKHTRLVDTQLHETMRVITGTIQPTPIPWLPALSNIAPPNIRRKAAKTRDWKKIMASNLPLKHELLHPPHLRLKSRSPFWSDPPNTSKPFSVVEEWCQSWHDSSTSNKDFITDPSARPSGFDLPRLTWKRLNRLRTGQGRCNDSMFKWGYAPSPECDCGEGPQTIHHIIEECPLRKFNGLKEKIYSADDEAILWINNLDIEI